MEDALRCVNFTFEVLTLDGRRHPDCPSPGRNLLTRLPGWLVAHPFPPERFDLVAAITILCLVEDTAPVFREMARVLRPGGRLVIGEPGKWSSWAAVRRVRGWLGSSLWRRARFRTAGELRGLAEAAGLGAECVQGAIFYPRWGFAARHMAAFDRRLGRVTTFGAAFVALSATKPDGGASIPR